MSLEANMFVWLLVGLPLLITGFVNKEHSPVLAPLDLSDKTSILHRPCLFLHGSGITGPRPSKFVTDMDSGPHIKANENKFYWADFATLLAGICTQVIYSFADTVNYPWTDKVLQDDYYTKALNIYKEGGIIFAHSMANVILAGACYSSNKCEIKWFNVGGPISGAYGANIACDISEPFDTCSTAVTSMKVTGYTMRFDKTHKGKYKSALAKTVYENDLFLGSMCGISAYGSGGDVGTQLAVLSTFTDAYASVRDWPSQDNDGMVEFDSCSKFIDNSNHEHFWLKKSFSHDPTSNNYVDYMNHLDQLGVRGNFNISETRRGFPLIWYKTMAEKYFHRKITQH